MSDEELKAMVDAFLAWPLPNDVAADVIACQPGAPHRTGTNLLTAAQARKMFEHCLADHEADLAALRAERDTWKGIACEYSDCLQDLCMTRLYDICRPVSHSWPGQKHVLAIRQAVDFLGRDAERYRHLRDIAGNDIMRKLMEEARPSHWDSIVDAAIARGKE